MYWTNRSRLLKNVTTSLPSISSCGDGFHSPGLWVSGATWQVRVEDEEPRGPERGAAVHLFLGDVEADPHHVPHGVGLLCLLVPHDPRQNRMRGEWKNAEDLQEVLRAVEVDDRIGVLVCDEFLVEKVFRVSQAVEAIH